MRRRTFALSLLAAPAQAQPAAWPSRPIRLLVAFSAGTASDLLGRLVAQRLSERMGASFVVENREGAGGTIAAALAARAAPDGHSLFLSTTALALAPRLFRQVTFRPVEDFASIGVIGWAPNVFVVGQGSPVTSMAGLIEAARQAPGRIRYASSGPGSGSWNAAELLKDLAGIEMEEIPYSSTAQATTDAITGQVDLHIPNLAGALPHIRGGRLRALAVTGRTRSASAPDIPATAELLPGFDAAGLFGLSGPAGLPAPVVERLNAELNAVLADPAVLATFRAAGVDPAPGPPEALSHAIADTLSRWSALMDRVGFRPQ
ncbi:MAG: tripartite tricarboxylate transporter substrate binding protein [Acetobacteraceae bacterium]|nr:tripartite tricarboxylate transporter substrate binding protein [Acetobacteraceae bacterium]